jgi:deoxyribonuclease IV
MGAGVGFAGGDEYTQPGRWQQLTCGTSDARMADLLRRSRLQTKNPRFDATEAYVDRAYLVLQLPAGRTDIHLDELRLSPVVAHAKYLINLASPHEELRRRSAEALARELVAAGVLGLDLVVVHAGSHGGDGEEKGMDRLVGGLDRVRELAASIARPSVRVAEPVVENSVGAGTQLCSTFDSLGEVVRRAGVRVCLDTAHAFVAGYDLSTLRTEGLENTVGPALALLHLNDARNGFGSRRDGHSKIGEGQIPMESWARLFAGLPGIPVVMETPYGGPEADAEEVRLVKELAGGLLVSPGRV